VSERDVLGNRGRGKKAEIETIWATMTNRTGHPVNQGLKFGSFESSGRDTGDSTHRLRR
jgi:hypothetical protein